MVNWTSNRVVEWGREFFANTPVSGVWAPEGTGLFFQKTGGGSWSLVRAIDDRGTRETLRGINALMFDLGYLLSEEGANWEKAPESKEEMREFENREREEIANSWCDDDGMKLRDMRPSETFPRFVEELEGDDGSSRPIWAYYLINENTGRETALDPDDYRYLTDDRHFMRFMNAEGVVFQALTRKEMMELADQGRQDEMITVGTRCPETNERVPPWMWGTCCSVNSSTS